MAHCPALSELGSSYLAAFTVCCELEPWSEGSTQSNACDCGSTGLLSSKPLSVARRIKTASAANGFHVKVVLSLRLHSLIVVGSALATCVLQNDELACFVRGLAESIHADGVAPCGPPQRQQDSEVKAAKRSNCCVLAAQTCA
eukprot:618670-Amphidinium_carterae.1